MLGLHRLEQVAIRPGLHGRGQVLFVLAHREHEDAHTGEGFFQGSNAIHPAHPGQVVVQQDQLGGLTARITQRLAHVRGLGYDLKTAILGQQGYQPAAEQGVVVHHHQSDKRHVGIVSARVPVPTRPPSPGGPATPD